MANLTPFRYPGAKNKLLPAISEYLDILLKKDPSVFIDAFVGGGSVALNIASRYKDTEIWLNDKDAYIYSFWKCIASEDDCNYSELIALISQKPTIQLFNSLRSTPPESLVDFAYRALFFNRTTFSGILRSGPIGGYAQTGNYTVDCRYNTKVLIDKIEKCRKMLLGRTRVSNYDFAAYPELLNTDFTVYLDPPYYKKGNALYQVKMSPSEHVKLYKILRQRKNWVLSYDDCPEIRSMYEFKESVDLEASYCIKNHWASKNELIITG